MFKLAQTFLSLGGTQFLRKYGAKSLKDVKKYITKNKIIFDGKKIIKNTGSQPKPKTTTKKIPVNPKKNIKKTTTKDSFDEQLKKKEGTKNFNARNKNATTTTTKPKKIIKKEPKLSDAQIKMLDRVNKTKKTNKMSAMNKAIIGTSVVGVGLSFLPKGGTKTKNTSGKGGRRSIGSNTKKSSTLSNKDLQNKKNMQRNNAYSLDDMLDSKQVRSAPSGFKDKESKSKGSGAFGANISFTGKDVKSLKENARKLSSQIDSLSITSMQKKRLKDELNTRKKNFGMDESYQKSFNIIKNKVKNQKFN
jgi:hypothetical protein